MKRENKRFLRLFFLMVLLAAIFVMPSVFAAEKNVDLTYEGEKVQNIVIDQDEKKVLYAETDIENASFQWQIMMNSQSETWVDIYDKTEASCELSYAVVKHMLNDSDSVYVRCKMLLEDEVVYSDFVTVTVNYIQEEIAQERKLDLSEYINVQDEIDTTVLNTNTFALLSADQEEDEEYVTITIKYLDIASLNGAEETAIYSPYIATIIKGSEFKQSVVSPTFLGFAPYFDTNNDKTINDNDASAQTVLCNYDAVNENIEIKIYYKPIKVNFAVKYFFQNINNDLYVEDATRYHSDQAETGTIVTNEYMEAKAGVTTGFTKMYHIPESVAADGSTVFECYYDRNYYLMQFDLNGGYGVDPLYARYETPFLVNDPIRHGYKFAGWKLSAVDMDGDGEWDDTIPTDISTELVSVIPAYNCQYQAQWETIETEYTVLYWLKDSEGKYNYLYSRRVAAVSGSQVSGKNDLKDVSNIDMTYNVFEKADTNVLVEGDGSTIVNVYYKPKEYTLRFYYAATTGTGSDEDGDGVNETYTSVKILGGSSYKFGQDGTNTSDDIILLDNIFGTDQIGKVTKLPQLNEAGKARNYTLGSISSSSSKNTYHYIEFTAFYGQNISNLWPCSVFESATRTSITENKNGWTGDQAFVSAWNGEHRVYYSQHNENETIKGNYEKLDYQLLFDLSKFNDESTVSYLCFWENGSSAPNWNVPELYVYRIWVPVLPGDMKNDSASTTIDGLKVEVWNGVKYKLIQAYDTCDDSRVDEQTQPSLEGYKAVGGKGSQITLTEEQKKLYKEGWHVDFYYARESYSFVMENHGDKIVNIPVNNNGTGGVAYETKLSSLNELNVLQDDFVPTYPTNLEENAYYFDGWYTTEQCAPGTRFDLSTGTMPSSGLILYANWLPETHTVRFFTTYDDMKAYEEQGTGSPYQVVSLLHGQTIGTVETPIRDGDGGLNLTFAGWFYMENGQKKAFSTHNIPVNQDMNMFAEWSSHSPQPYCVSYVLLSDPNTKVADDSKGYAYGGSTRTFNAKAGDPYNQLYSQYNKGYFPTVSSHSITIQAEADKDNLQHNIFTFYYVEAQSIEYTVRYVNKETNAVMDTITYTTSSSVVTERFKAYPDMVPDAFYKRLVLEVKWDEEANKYVGTDNNVVTFYYTPNTTSAYYAVHFMLEKLDATEAEKGNYAINGTGGYEETGTHIEGVGKVGSKVYIKPQEISGFKVIDNERVPIVYDNGSYEGVAEGSSDGYKMQITKNGAELYIFYERKDYPYTVNYYEYNTTKSLNPSESGTADYGKEVTETAKKINGYTCVSSQTQTITIREESGGDAKLNVITFYYSPLQYVAEYVALPDDGGWLSNTIEVISGTEDLTGSVPTANQYYEFAGWYLDEVCTQSVTAEYGTVDQSTNRFIPDKTKLSETERNIFYAKFVKKVGNLTIQRNNVQDLTQIFVYEIKNNSTNESIYVTIQGNGSATVYNLPLGEYTVKQQNGWSWRFEDAALSVDHQNAEGTTVTFSDSVKKEQWLNGNSTLIKNQWRQ